MSALEKIMAKPLEKLSFWVLFLAVVIIVGAVAAGSIAIYRKWFQKPVTTVSITGTVTGPSSAGTVTIKPGEVSTNTGWRRRIPRDASVTVDLEPYKQEIAELRARLRGNNSTTNALLDSLSDGVLSLSELRKRLGRMQEQDALLTAPGPDVLPLRIPTRGFCIKPGMMIGRAFRIDHAPGWDGYFTVQMAWWGDATAGLQLGQRRAGVHAAQYIPRLSNLQFAAFLSREYPFKAGWFGGTDHDNEVHNWSVGGGLKINF